MNKDNQGVGWDLSLAFLKKMETESKEYTKQYTQVLAEMKWEEYKDLVCHQPLFEKKAGFFCLGDYEEYGETKQFVACLLEPSPGQFFKVLILCPKRDKEDCPLRVRKERETLGQTERKDYDF